MGPRGAKGGQTMSRTKSCPACQREIPLLAVRCKHCGFKLSGQPAPEPTPSTPPPPPPPRASRISSPPPAPPAGRGSTPPPPPPRRISSVPPPPPPVRVTAPPPPPPKRISAPPPPPPKRFSNAPPPPPRAEEVPLPRPRVEPRPEPARGDDSSWIPAADGSQELDDDAILQPDATEDIGGEDQIVADDDREGDEEVVDGFEADGKPADLFLFRHVFSGERIEAFGKGSLPRPLVSFLGRVRILHALAGGIVLLALIVAVVVIAVASGGPQPPSSGVAPSPGAGKIAPPGAAGASGGRAGAVSPGGAAKAEPPKPVPEAGKSCTPWSRYPALPWREHLEAIAAAVGAGSPCGMLGASPQKIAEALRAFPQVGPCGLDFYPGGGLLEAFPAGKADRRAPNMEFQFVGDRLFEVRLNYRETIPLETGAKELGELFGVKPSKTKDYMGRKVSGVADGDLVVELVEEDWYGRKLRTVVFASAAVRAALATDRSHGEIAQKELAAGDAALAKWEVQKALDHYESAADHVPAFGYAYVKQGVALTRLERFDDVERVARRALEVSGEHRAHAEAFGLLAVVALFRGDVGKGIENFESAAKTDAANGFFASSAEELRTGVYAVDRVARTAARMECRGEKGLKATEKGLLARGNFPSMEKYFAVLSKASVDPAFKKAKKEFARWECP